jgi:hypothetical protein
MTCRSCWVSVASSAGSRARTPLSSPRQHLRCSASSLSRRTICDRTAATLAGDLGFDDAWIAKCLDHAASKKQEQIVPSVTGKVYNHSKRMKEKRAVLDGVAAELRRIIGGPAVKVVEQDQLRLAA